MRSNLDYLDNWSADRDEDATCSPVPSLSQGGSSQSSPLAPSTTATSLSSLSISIAEYERLRRLGSPDETIEYQEVESSSWTNPAYTQFRICFQVWITGFLCYYGILSQEDHAVTFKGTDTVSMS